MHGCMKIVIFEMLCLCVGFFCQISNLELFITKGLNIYTKYDFFFFFKKKERNENEPRMFFTSAKTWSKVKKGSQPSD